MGILEPTNLPIINAIPMAANAGPEHTPAAWSCVAPICVITAPMMTVAMPSVRWRLPVLAVTGSGMSRIALTMLSLLTRHEATTTVSIVMRKPANAAIPRLVHSQSRTNCSPSPDMITIAPLITTMAIPSPAKVPTAAAASA